MMNMRPGSPAQHGLPDNAKEKAMIPPNQGLNQQNLPSPTGNPAGEHQSNAQLAYGRQQDMLNRQGNQTYNSNAMSALQSANITKESNKQHKIQMDLNQLLSNIIEHGTDTGGMHLQKLNQEMQDPNFPTRIAKGFNSGTSLLS